MKKKSLFVAAFSAFLLTLSACTGGVVTPSSSETPPEPTTSNPDDSSSSSSTSSGGGESTSTSSPIVDPGLSLYINDVLFATDDEADASGNYEFTLTDAAHGAQLSFKSDTTAVTFTVDSGTQNLTSDLKLITPATADNNVVVKANTTSHKVSATGYFHR